MERIRIDDTIATGKLVFDKSSIWAWSDVYCSSAFICVVAASAYFLSPLLALPILGLAGFTAYRASHLLDMVPIPVVYPGTTLPEAASAAIQSLGWHPERAGIRCLHATIGDFWSGYQWVVVVQADGRLLFNSLTIVKFGFSPFSRDKAENARRFADAFQSRLAEAAA